MALSATSPAGGILSDDHHHAHASVLLTRHLLTANRARETIAPHLFGGPGKVGRPAQDNRRFINTVFWILRTGAPWRGLPPDYGHWNTTHRRFSRWQEDGHWARILSKVSYDPDLEWLMIDASHIKVYQHGTGAVGRQSGLRSDQMGLNTKPHLAVDALGMPVSTEERRGQWRAAHL